MIESLATQLCGIIKDVMKYDLYPSNHMGLVLSTSALVALRIHEPCKIVSLASPKEIPAHTQKKGLAKPD